MVKISPFLQKRIHDLKDHPTLTALLVSCLAGLIVFVFLFGTSSLHATNVNWMYNRGWDSLQHQLGWMAFRYEPWSLQFGTIHSLAYPYGTSIVYTDSIPLLAIFFKLFSPILPMRFQYFGYWTLLCWILTIFVTMEILRELKIPFGMQLLGGILLSLTPTLITRTFYHDALCGQWLILAAILLEIKHIHGTFQPWKWVILVILSLLIHAYLFFMVGVFFTFDLIFEGLSSHQWRNVLIPFVSAVGACLALGWMLNMYGTPVETDYQALNYYSFNLMSFFNPNQASTFLTTQKYAQKGQYEGFAYPGLGNFFLLAFCVPVLIQKGISWRSFPKALPLILPAGLLSILSVGNALTVNKATLVEFQLPALFQTFFETFRCMGRFIWPVYYLILLGVMLYVMRKIPKAQILLILAIGVQWIDLQPLIKSKNYLSISGYSYPLASDFWKEAPKSYEHLMILPPENPVWKDYYAFHIYAVEHHLTVNWIYLARMDYAHLMPDMSKAREQMLAGQMMDDRTIYISNDRLFIDQLLEVHNPHLAVCPDKKFWYIVTTDGIPAKQMNLLQGCTFGNSTP